MSPIGRTKTTPAPTDLVTKIGLAVYSCSNFPFGFFNAYGNPARKDSVDYVLHLGDYIYEYQNGQYGYGQSIGRIPLPDRTIYTLYDYRKRIATYRTDLDLLLSHQTFPWIPVWDDHGKLLFTLGITGTNLMSSQRSPIIPTEMGNPGSTTPKLPSLRMAALVSTNAK